jgi:hypothetical protein
MTIQTLLLTVTLSFPSFAELAFSQSPSAPESITAELQDSHPVNTPDSQPLDLVHNDLRALLRGVIDAIDHWDLDKLASFFHKNAVIVWPDATVSKGPAEMRGYLLAKTTGSEKIVEAFKTQITVDELTRLYANNTMGIAFGTSLDNFTMTNGINLIVPGRWSATLIKEDGRWLIATFHSSTDLFDNPLIASARNLMIWVAIGCIVGGAIIGLFFTRWYSARAKSR